MTKCKRCASTNKDGTRCKNRVACQIDCTAYCHVHSKGYNSGANKVCTKPSKRRAPKSPRSPGRRKK